MILRYGDTGPTVETLQRELIGTGKGLTADGIFGPATERALRAFQRERGLVVDGLAGPNTRQALQRGEDNRALRQADLVGAADCLEVDLAAVMAITEVESRGHGFHTNGEPVILFERHIMRRRLEHHGISPVGIEKRRPNLVNHRPGGYVGGIAEHRRLADAREIHDAAAIESCSWGLFQIMGFHWARLGYADAATFEAAMRHSEARQLEVFVRFIEADGALHAALRRHDWRDVARRYNGPDFEKNDYDTKLAAAHRRHARALTHAA